MSEKVVECYCISRCTYPEYHTHRAGRPMRPSKQEKPPGTFYVIGRHHGQSWRDVVKEAATLADRPQCLVAFDARISQGMDPVRAAWESMYDWNCLPYEKRT